MGLVTLKTGVQVAPKVGNLPSKFGHARPLGSRIIRYVRNGQTNGQTDGQKQRLWPLPYGRGHNNLRNGQSFPWLQRHRHVLSVSVRTYAIKYL